MTINIDGGQSTNEFYKRCVYYLLPFFREANKKQSNIDSIQGKKLSGARHSHREYDMEWMRNPWFWGILA